MKSYQAPGRLPFLLYLVRDFIIFRRRGLSWRSAWAASFDYWRFDRSI